MPADEEFCRMFQQLFLYAGRILTGIAADVSDEHPYPFECKIQVFRVADAELCPINITIYRTERFKSFQLIGQGGVANIAGMPDLIYLLKVFKHLRMQVTMRIRH